MPSRDALLSSSSGHAGSSAACRAGQARGSAPVVASVAGSGGGGGCSPPPARGAGALPAQREGCQEGGLRLSIPDGALAGDLDLTPPVSCAPLACF